MIIAKMTQNQAVSTETTEEGGAVVFVPPNKPKKSSRALRETLGDAACIVALRCSGALIAIPLSAKKLIPSPRFPV